MLGELLGSSFRKRRQSVVLVAKAFSLWNFHWIMLNRKLVIFT